MFQFAKLKNGIIRPGGKISAEGIEDGHCEHFFAFFSFSKVHNNQFYANTKFFGPSIPE